MKLTNSLKAQSVTIGVGDNPKNAVGGLLNHAMNKTSTRSSADVPVDRTAPAALPMQTKEQIEAGLRAKYGDQSRKKLARK